MFRRTAILLSGLAIFAVACPAVAQPAGKVYRIGYLSNRYKVEYREEALREGLKKLGYVEGRNLVFEWRFAKGKRARLGALAAELVRSRVDCIVTSGTGAARAAKKATRTAPIPVVIANLFDPVMSGIVKSLARPGENITGFTTLSVGLAGKQLELLKESLPHISRIFMLVERAHPNNPPVVEGSMAAARKIGVQLEIIEVSRPAEIENAFRTAAQGHADAFIVRGTGLMHRNRLLIVGLEAETGLPVMYTERRFVDAGGLMAYGIDRADPYRRAGAYIDKILKGTRAGDLPVQQPVKFDLVINVKTARSAGIAFSRPFLLRATELIE